MGMRPRLGREAVAFLTVTLSALAAASTQGYAQAAFVAPPRTITDITAILDQQKPNPDTARKLRADADAPPPAGAGRAALARFYYGRSQARSQLGELESATADAEKAVEYGQGSTDVRELGLLRQGVAIRYQQMGDPRRALQALQILARESDQPGAKGRLFNTHRLMAEQSIAFGDLTQAEFYVRRNQALILQARSWPEYSGFLRVVWEADVEHAKGLLHAARGQFREAEVAYGRALDWRKDEVRLRSTFEFAPPARLLEQNKELLIASQGMMKARQGRTAEGEADIRRALLSSLKAAGKYNALTLVLVARLAALLVEQGRFEEAEKLTRTSIEIQDALGMAKDSQRYVATLNALATMLNLRGRWAEAAAIYARLDSVTSRWEPSRKDALMLSTAHIVTLYNTGNLEAGLAAAERLLGRQRVRFGDQHVETALARGAWAMGLVRAGRDSDAMREFKAAVPVLASPGRNAAVDDAIETSAREQRKRLVIESYMALLARAATSEAALESFRLADLVRARSVQQALAASSTRAAASDRALAELVRREQDLQKQIGAQLGLLNNLLASPPEQRDDKTLAELRVQIDKLGGEHARAKQDIGKRFPKYADLIDPKPPTADEVRMVLRPDEALLSFYLGTRSSFVWVVPKDGPVLFAAIPRDAGAIESMIVALRQALEPDVIAIGDIPPFDVALAHELSGLLLKPVEAGWKPAKHLIVVTNGALGRLPLSLLPTAPPPARAQGEPLFAEYRDVAWLARSHAVSTVPSASALVTLRRLPARAPGREPLIGFGDPLFSQEQALAAASQSLQDGPQLAAATRGMPLQRRAAAQTDGVDSAELGLLPRLPDTAHELKSIALALQADPAKALHLGIDANEQRVKSSKLANYRVIAFATHGLAPGDLNGLTQPALALTAPDVARVEGDGLLTMEEILSLKLDADWVVLSACNTAAGADAEAEAASGLGRAFFYAGTRALLVTNWSVHSASARDLVTELFRRQSADPSLTRAEALQQAILALMNGPGFTDGSRRTLFTYAHPLFWAPYSIIGDGQ
jgi:CHAT domain-containing protein/tetratricopeptide (TPR) repeat protein